MPRTPKEIRRKVRDALLAVRQQADEGAVHELRTGLRRCEALAGRELPKSLKRMRKQAGRVRDYDVMSKLAGKLQLDQSQPDATERLLSELAARRQTEAERLQQTARTVKKGRLKRWTSNHVNRPDRSLQDVEYDVQKVITDPDYRNLGQHNLHDFRLDIKPLRYRAEALDGEPAKRTAERLNHLQTAIGDWHDLMLLLDFAEEALGGSEDSAVGQIRQAAEASYQACLHEALRQRNTLTERAVATAA